MKNNFNCNEILPLAHDDARLWWCQSALHSDKGLVLSS